MTYSKDVQAKAAAELDALPADSIIAEMITDYSKTRDACRVGMAKRGLGPQWKLP